MMSPIPLWLVNDFLNLNLQDTTAWLGPLNLVPLRKAKQSASYRREN